MQIPTRTMHSHQGKNKPLPFVYSPFTGYYRAGRYLDDAGVHMCESKAEQKLAVHEQEMRCAGFAMANRGAVSGREMVQSEHSYRVNGLWPERICWVG